MNPLAALLAGPSGSGAAGSPTAGQAQSPQSGLFAALLGANGELQLNAQTTLGSSGQTDLAGLLAAQQNASGEVLALAAGLGGELDGVETALLPVQVDAETDSLAALAPTLGPLAEEATDSIALQTAADADVSLVDSDGEQAAVSEGEDGDAATAAASPVTPATATPGEAPPAAAQTAAPAADAAKQTTAATQQQQTVNAAPAPTAQGQTGAAQQNAAAPQAAPAQQPATEPGRQQNGNSAPAPLDGEPRRAEFAQGHTPAPANAARGRANLAQTVETLTIASNAGGGQSLVQVVEADTGGGKSAISLDPAVSSLQMRAGAATPTPGGAQAPQVPLNTLAVHIAQQAQNGNRRFDIRLDPPELGRLEIRIDVSRDGQVTTHMVVERSETLDLLQRDSRALERALQNAGLDTSEGGLKFSLKGEGQGQAQDMGPDGKPRGDSANAEGNGDGDSASDDADMTGGGRDYVARDGLDIRI